MAIIDGKAIAQRMIEKMKPETQAQTLTLAVLAGDAASKAYTNGIRAACYELGVSLKIYKLSEDIKTLNDDQNIQGILIQMPLPGHIDKSIVTSIAPEKDVGGLRSSPFVAPTARAIIALLKEQTKITGKHAVIVGRSSIVGKPTAHLLLDEHAAVTVCHSKTRNLSHYTKQADILVVAAGKPRLITADMVKDGAVVIDVGINYIDGKMCGDVDFENVKNKASAITPVPGGVGPMTIAMLMDNVLIAAKRAEMS